MAWSLIPEQPEEIVLDLDGRSRLVPRLVGRVTDALDARVAAAAEARQRVRDREQAALAREAERDEAWRHWRASVRARAVRNAWPAIVGAESALWAVLGHWLLPGGWWAPGTAGLIAAAVLGAVPVRLLVDVDRRLRRPAVRVWSAAMVAAVGAWASWVWAAGLSLPAAAAWLAALAVFGESWRRHHRRGMGKRTARERHRDAWAERVQPSRRAARRAQRRAVASVVDQTLLARVGTGASTGELAAWADAHGRGRSWLNHRLAALTESGELTHPRRGRWALARAVRAGAREDIDQPSEGSVPGDIPADAP